MFSPFVRISFNEVIPESLVDVYTLDSRYAFCVYNNGTGQKKVLGVTYRKVSGKLYFTCFTKECRYEIQSGEIVSVEKNPLKDIPIIEYERSFDIKILSASISGIFLSKHPVLSKLLSYSIF